MAIEGLELPGARQKFKKNTTPYKNREKPAKAARHSGSASLLMPPGASRIVVDRLAKPQLHQHHGQKTIPTTIKSQEAVQ